MTSPAKAKRVDHALLVIFAVIFFWVSWSRHHDSMDSVIGSDTKGYYAYLPAVFVYHSLHKLPAAKFQNYIPNDKGEVITKYTCGNAFFYLPFFLGAHLFAHIAHYPPDGLSPPYGYALMMCGVFWGFVGLFLLRALLLRYFSRWATWLALLCIMLGTNFYDYATFEIGMSHVYSFCLFAAILLALDTWYKRPSAKLAILIGWLFGWIVLVRPTNAVLLVFLALYQVATSGDLKARIQLLKSHALHILYALPFFAVMMVPQLLYWKEMTGHWATYSYEIGFDFWGHPHIAQVLFDTQNGLFIYSPILIFFVWGLAAHRRDQVVSFGGTLILFCAITYIFASWCAWWFGAAFGHRCYVEYYAIFALPIAAAMRDVITIKKWGWKIPLFMLMALFCYYNIGMSALYMKIGIFDGPAWRWNWDTWFGVVKQLF